MALKPLIWDALQRMQRPTESSEVLCAYCERPIYANRNGREQRHIEHFWRKNANVGWPERMFDWNNLYGSCSHERPRTCGHYKDKHAWPYIPSELLDPCVDDPSQFLGFAMDGTVYPHGTLSDAHKRRAEETIRVFNLNEAGLVSERKHALMRLVSAYSDAVNAGFSEHDLHDYLRAECDAMASMPFTATRNHWTV